LGVAINGSVTVRELMKENFLSVNKVRWQILRSTNGSLSLADKIHFFQVTADVGRGSVEMVDLTEGGWFVSEVDVSGNEVVMMSTDGSETITRNYLQDEQVVMSVGRGVAVVNATNQEGLATRAASVAEAMGYDVLSVINTPEKKAVTELRVMGSVEEQGFYTYPLERVFGVQARVDEKVESEYRADVVLIVGDDYYDLMYKKTKEW
jgi:Tfp pilus assembly PilM family ATPase